LDTDTAAALSALDVSVSSDGAVVLRYRIADKNTALTALEKMLGLYAPTSNRIPGPSPFSMMTNGSLAPSMDQRDIPKPTSLTRRAALLRLF
jgi:hypothetical protein